MARMGRARTGDGRGKREEGGATESWQDRIMIQTGEGRGQRGERKQHTEIGSRDKAKLQASSTKLQGNSNPQATGAALVASWLVASLVLGV